MYKGSGYTRIQNKTKRKHFFLPPTINLQNTHFKIADINFHFLFDSTKNRKPGVFIVTDYKYVIKINEMIRYKLLFMVQLDDYLQLFISP